MKYSLRNQVKIIYKFDEKYLKRMTDSLDKYFAENKTIDEINVNGKREPYNFILVNDIGHTENMFEFYVIRKLFNSYLLAYKGIIG